MQALILAGGKGTRLRPLTVYTPKPIVPICNRPFLLYQIDTLRRAGIMDITLSLSYQPNKIEQLLGDGSDYGVNLCYTVEPQPMGTAGAYKFAEELIRERTIVFNGDILTDLDLKAAIREHDEKYVYQGRVVRQSGWTICQYWFFFAYNPWRSGFHGVNDHESDWEMISVYLYEDAGELKPEWAAYASHDFHVLMAGRSNSQRALLC